MKNGRELARAEERALANLGSVAGLSRLIRENLATIQDNADALTWTKESAARLARAMAEAGFSPEGSGSGIFLTYLVFLVRAGSHHPDPPCAQDARDCFDALLSACQGLEEKRYLQALMLREISALLAIYAGIEAALRAQEQGDLDSVQKGREAFYRALLESLAPLAAIGESQAVRQIRASRQPREKKEPAPTVRALAAKGVSQAQIAALLWQSGVRSHADADDRNLRYKLPKAWRFDVAVIATDTRRRYWTPRLTGAEDRRAWELLKAKVENTLRRK